MLLSLVTRPRKLSKRGKYPCRLRFKMPMNSKLRKGIRLNCSISCMCFIKKWGIVIGMKKEHLLMHFRQLCSSCRMTRRSFVFYSCRISSCWVMLGGIRGILLALRMSGRMILNIRVGKPSFRRKSCFHLLEFNK